MSMPALPKPNLSTAKAILFGLIGAGALLAVSILGGALFGTSPSTAEVPAVDRYQVTQMPDGTTWRLDRQTGGMVACRMTEGTLLCGDSNKATALPQYSAKELDERRMQERLEIQRMQDRRDAREQAIIDRFFRMFEMVLTFVLQQEMQKMENERIEKTAATSSM